MEPEIEISLEESSHTVAVKYPNGATHRDHSVAAVLLYQILKELKEQNALLSAKGKK